MDGLDEVDFIEKVKTQQRNWIGRSEGAEVDFQIAGKQEKLRVFTTRPDTLFGATYMVLSPEHPLIDKYRADIQNCDAVDAYREQAARKSDFERTEMNKEKTGVQLEGLFAVNPVNGEQDPHLGVRLCAHELRHRRHHGRARRMTRATGSLPKPSACPSSRWSRAATWKRKPIPTARTA